jgi:hypothetical protein
MPRAMGPSWCESVPRKALKREELKRRLAATIYRLLYWGRNHVRPGVRSLIGVCLMIGGVFGFLPVLGFWMFPVGVAFVALDVPSARHRIDAWMLKLAREGKLDRPPRRAPHEGASQPVDDQTTSNQ